MSYNNHLRDGKNSEQLEYEQQIISDSLNLQLTIDELKILKECQRNSMWGRGFPLGIATAGGLYYLMKNKVIRRNNFSVIIGGISGFFLGVMSYRQTCMDKLLSLPNSTLKERILIAQGQKPQVRIDVQSQDTQGWFDSILPNSDESPMASSLDVEPYEDRHVTDFPAPPDADTAYAVDPPLQSLIGTPFTTYDDLRQRNRENYENARNRRGPQQPNYPPRPPMGPAPPEYDRSFDSQAPPPSSSRRDDFL